MMGADSSIAGKIGLVTGVTSGLGKAIAIEFSRLGATVIGCGRREESERELKSQIGKGFEFLQADLSSREDIDEYVAFAAG